jgi:ribulose-5-phosphate 4-epimerase/fuculose-1-phosphate aldolase
MTDVPDAVLQQFVEACRRVAARGLVQCSSGNLSLRLDSERLLATATRSWMETLTAADVAVCRLAGGALLEGRRPTAEIALHAGVLRARPDVNVVLHFQSPAATALACRPSDPASYFVIPEIPFYIGPVARVPCLPPGSPALADAVVEAVRSHDLVVMTNHGHVTVARDFDHAIQNAEFFELACGIILGAGDALTPMPQAVAEELLARRARAGDKGA